VDVDANTFSRFNPKFKTAVKYSLFPMLPSRDVDLDIYGDTHCRTLFFTREGVPVVNPGALIAGYRKTGVESYVIYDSDLNLIQFFEYFLLALDRQQYQQELLHFALDLVNYFLLQEFQLAMALNHLTTVYLLCTCNRCVLTIKLSLGFIKLDLNLNRLQLVL
jgi:hypothetical protein